jgi:hypothetical protein
MLLSRAEPASVKGGVDVYLKASSKTSLWNVSADWFDRLIDVQQPN